MSKPKKNLEKARQIKGLGNSGLKIFFCFSRIFIGYTVAILTTVMV